MGRPISWPVFNCGSFLKPRRRNEKAAGIDSIALECAFRDSLGVQEEQDDDEEEEGGEEAKR